MSAHRVPSGQSGRPLTHEQAEALVSARLDAPLEPVENRNLLLHLQSCAACRAFAVQLEVMAREFEALPMLPASPIVRREVHDRIQTRPPFWSRWTAAGSVRGMQAAPAALGLMILLVAASAILLIRMASTDPGNGIATSPGAIDAPADIAVVLPTTPTATSEEQTGLSQPPPAPTATARVVSEPMTSPTPGSADAQSSALQPRDDAAEDSVALDQPAASTAPALSTRQVEPPSIQSAAEEDTQPDPEPSEVERDLESPPGQADSSESETEPEQQIAESTSETDDSVNIAAASDDTAISVAEEVEGPATPGPTMTPSSEPTATTESSPTASPDPPRPTETIQPTSTPTTLPTSTPTPQPTSTATNEPTATLTPEPTATQTAEPTATPTEEPPPAQPTIAPVQGSSVEPAGEQSSEATGTSGSGAIVSRSEDGSPPIAPVQQQGDAPEEVSEDDAEITDVDEPTEIASEPEQADAVGGQGPSILDSADVVGNLGSGVAAQSGRLEFRLYIDWYTVTLSEGSLAVADTSGSILMNLGPAGYPVWSPQGLVLLYASYGGAYPEVRSWDSETGSVYQVTPPDGVAVSDIPGGWFGSRFYYQRTFPDSPGLIEIRSASWDGSDDQLVWTGNEVYPVSARPLATATGLLIATSSNWLLVTPDGSSIDMGGNPYGSIGVPILSPGGSLIAYNAGGQVYVAWTDDPGVPINGGFPYDGGFGAGFAFATTGEEVVVSGSNRLTLYSIFGETLGSASATVPVAAPYWIEDRIYFLEIGSTTSLRVISASAIPGS